MLGDVDEKFEEALGFRPLFLSIFILLTLDNMMQITLFLTFRNFPIFFLTYIITKYELTCTRCIALSAGLAKFAPQRPFLTKPL